MGDEILTLAFGGSAVKCSEALWEQKSFEHDVVLARLEAEEEEIEIEKYVEKDPLRGEDKRPRALVYDVRSPPAGDWIVEEMKRWEDSDWRSGDEHSVALNSSRKPEITARSLPVPIWAGAEAVSGFQLHGDGLREGGVLGVEWWESADDILRKELEKCDRLTTVLTIIDAQHGGFSGVAASLMSDLADECRGAQRVIYCGLDDESIDNNDTLTLRLSAASRTLALRQLYDLGHALVPVDLHKKTATIGAAIDLTTLPFRRRVLKSYDLVQKFAGSNPRRRFATLSAGSSSADVFTPLFQPWGKKSEHNELKDLFVHAPPGGVNVPPLRAAAIGPTFPHDLAAKFVRRAAHRIDFTTNFEARRLIPKLLPSSDDLIEAHEDILHVLEAYVEDE